jgi:hypothetical protein
LSISKHNTSNEQALFVIKERRKDGRTEKSNKMTKSRRPSSKIKVEKKRDGRGETNQSSLSIRNFLVERRLGFFLERWLVFDPM